MFRDSKSFLIVSIVALLVVSRSVIAIAEQNQSAPIRFAILGDRTGGMVPGVYEQMVAEVARLRPDLWRGLHRSIP